MPKPNTSNKPTKPSEGWATEASAGASNSSGSIPPTMSEIPPDKTYAMCMELCKEMSETVLRGINECFVLLRPHLSL